MLENKLDALKLERDAKRKVDLTEKVELCTGKKSGTGRKAWVRNSGSHRLLCWFWALK